MGERTLDLGCGEGRVLRDPLARGHTVIAIDDLSGTMRERARELRPGARLCVSVTHPTCGAGGFDSKAPDAPFIIPGSYLEVRPREAGLVCG